MRSVPLLRFFLIVIFLVAQLGSLTHGIYHACGERTPLSDHTLHANHCDWCGTYSQLGHALASSEFDFASQNIAIDHLLLSFVSFIAIPPAFFSARAPPFFSSN